MGATLTPISPTLRHRPQKSTCRSVARNNQFPCEGNEIVGKGGGRGGERNEGGRQNWCSRQSVVSGFFSVSRAGFFVGIFGSEKKLRGTLLLDPLASPMTVSTRAIDWNRRQRARGGGKGNDRRHPWFPCDFHESFFAYGGGRKGGKLKYPPRQCTYVGTRTSSSDRENYSNPNILLCTKIYCSLKSCTKIT